MWKKAKRILSCILALVLLLSMANGQQVFVQADSEAVIKTQAEDKAGSKEASGNKEESSSARTTEKKQETTTEKSTEKPAEKPTETTTESGKEDGKSDKPDKSDENNGKDSEDKDTKKEEEETTENQDTKKEDKNSEEKSEDKAEETTDTAEETSTEEQENTAEEIGTTQEEAPEATTMQEEEQTTGVDATESTGGMKEYIPQEQPAEISVKAYAKEGVFPEGTSMKVRKINEKEKTQAESALKNEVEYDGFLGYDISFYDKDGKEIEPEEGSVKVSLQLKESALSKEADKTTLTIQHFDDSKKQLNVEQVASAASGTMEVQSGKVSAQYSVDSFSVFTITWKNNSTASLRATCIDTAGQQVTIQYNEGTATGTINGSSVTYDANKENITDVSDVSTLAPTVQQATFLKAVIATSQSTANQSGTEIRYLRLDSGAWQYSLDKSEWNNIGSNNLYYIYNKNSVSDSVDSISFAYYGLDEINDMHSIAARDTVKFTVSLVDENGNNETYELPQGSVIPDKYTFHSSSVNMDAASFAQMGIIVPGYTYEGGYAYFYWYGNFAGEKFSVSNFKNMGANSTKYGLNKESHYDSYIGYTGTHPYGAHAGNADYSKDTFGERGTDYYAYNPTGTLRIVFKKVSSTVAYKSNFVDAYKNDTYRLIDEKAMEMHQIGSSTEYYGKLKTVTATVPKREGYTFKGWYMEKDADGNGTGTKITVPTDDNTEYKRDAYYYAKWEPKTYSLSVKKIVDTSGENNMGDKNESFTFTLTLKKENTPYKENITGLTKTSTEGQYTFSLKDGETMKADLPYKYEYTITEDAKDYTVTITAPSGVSKDTDKKLVSGTVDSDKEITFTNKKTIVPPTGVNNTMTAWFLMTGATLILGAVFFLFEVRRKRLMA